ncbi:MFS transporter [Nonomuraea africana]|uniref:MFS transporter n=1 Tax=Nonomuraea africana TaxID=46171 RepID=UPI0033E7AA65
MTTSVRTAPPHPPQAISPVPTLVVFTLTAIMSAGQLYSVIPLLGDMAADWQVAPDGLSWLVTAFGIGYAAGFLLFGPLSDRYGRRRMIGIGLPLAALVTALVALSPGQEVALGLRVLQGLVVAIFPPAALSYLAERLEPRHRMVGISIVTSGFLAAAVLLQIAAQSLVGVVGWRGLFVGSAVLFAAAAVATRLIMRPDEARDRAGSLPAAYRAIPALLRSPALVLRCLATVTVLLTFVAAYTGLQINGTPDLLALRAGGLPSLLLIPLLMPWLARVPAVPRALAAFALGALSLALIAATGPGTIGLALLLAVYVAAVALVTPSLNVSIVALAGQARGAALALFTFALFLGGSLGPQLAAAFPTLTPLMYGLAAAMAAGALAVFVSTRKVDA